MKKRKKGMTLIEILLSFAIVSIIIGVSFPLYGSVYSNFQKRNVKDVIVISIRRAQKLSSVSFADDSWGVKLETNSATVFKGSDFDTRDDSYDENYELQGVSSFSGDTEIYFQKNKVFPVSSYTATFADLALNEFPIYVGEKGKISY